MRATAGEAPRRCREVAACVIVALFVCASCGSGGRGARTTTSRGTAPPARLTGAHPCAGVPGFTCAELRVPLDHAGRAPGTLGLRVGLATSRAGDRHGWLVFLAGGPGQPGIPLLNRVRARLGPALAGYRLVTIDQRGTGAGALRCPELQAAAGSSDLVVPPPGAVEACARSIGPDRRFFTTAETIADLDALRAALGAARITLDGVSYGTLVAERYALSYPRRVARVVLDSVVPQQGADPLELANLQASARVLGAVCAATGCRTDPAADLAAIVRSRHDGPELLDALVDDSVVAPTYPGMIAALHAAREGAPRPLAALLALARRDEVAPADLLSQGLHDSALCAELGPPWNPGASPASRARILAQAADRLPAAAVFPFDRATAAGNGIAAGCARWPATPADRVSSRSGGRLPPVPVLLLAGGRDLSTPLAWARAEASQAPDGRLVVAPDSGHSVQTRGGRAVRREVARFLAGAP